MDTSPRPDRTPASSPVEERMARGVRWEYRGEVPDEVADLLDGVRWEYRQPVPNDVAAGHLRAILAASAETPAPTGRRWGSWIRRASALGAVKIALTATAAVAATGSGLAATGNLPAPAQQVVSDVGARIGLTIPAPDTPGDREDGKPGIGEGGVPGMIEDGADPADLPGKSGDAPGHQDPAVRESEKAERASERESEKAERESERAEREAEREAEKAARESEREARTSDVGTSGEQGRDGEARPDDAPSSGRADEAKKDKPAKAGGDDADDADQ